MKYVINTTKDDLAVRWDGKDRTLPAGIGMVVEDHIAERFAEFHPSLVEVHEMSELHAVEEGNEEAGFTLDLPIEGEAPKEKAKKVKKTSKRTKR